MLQRYRLKPYEEIEQIVAKEKAPLLILKTLRENQQANSFLNHFSGSRVIWIYRNYWDVANSSLIKWGERDGIQILTSILNDNASNHWGSESMSDNTRAIVQTYFREDMSPVDAIVLYWYTRNILFFELNLDKNPNVFLCKYEKLVTEPDQVMRQIYRFLDYSYPGDHVVRQIHQKSVNRGKHIQISQEIEALCDDLLHRLDNVYAVQMLPVIQR
jgi:hypothetical protein